MRKIDKLTKQQVIEKFDKYIKNSERIEKCNSEIKKINLLLIRMQSKFIRKLIIESILFIILAFCVGILFGLSFC